MSSSKNNHSSRKLFAVTKSTIHDGMKVYKVDTVNPGKLIKPINCFFLATIQIAGTLIQRESHDKIIIKVISSEIRIILRFKRKMQETLMGINYCQMFIINSTSHKY